MMDWRCFRVIFQLSSSMHIGYGRAGNLHQTRPYVTGRTLWGALTMRLTRDKLPKGQPLIPANTEKLAIW
jgi:hypothetical protein